MRERSGPVLLNEEMRRPGKGVTRNQRQRKQPPFADGHQKHHKADCCKRAQAMQHARRRLAVLAEIVRPELGKRIELSSRHGKFAPVILAEMARCRRRRQDFVFSFNSAKASTKTHETARTKTYLSLSCYFVNRCLTSRISQINSPVKPLQP